MNFCRHPSLELNWLPLSDRKTLATPHVVMVDEPNAGGFYSPRGQSCRDSSVPTLGERDIIAVSTHWDDSRIASTLAHEFRHLQQHYLPSLPRIRAAPWLDWNVDWEKQLRLFYRGRPWEMDALRYERRHAKDDANERTVEILSVL